MPGIDGDEQGVSTAGEWMSARTALHADPRRLQALHGARRLFEFSPEAGRRLIDIDDARLDSLELGGLYSALFSAGRWAPPRWLMDGPHAPAFTLLRPEAAFIAADMLRSSERQACERSFSARDESGLWLVGSLGSVTVVLRVDGGSDPESAMRSAWQSLRLSTPAVAACLMPQPDRPAAVVQQMVVFQPAVEAPRREWFVRGTELAVSSIPVLAVRIVEPRQGGIVDGSPAAADPSYRVMFRASAGLPELRWFLDGAPIGEGERAWWRPLAGLYRLELRSAAGELIDSVEFAARAPLH